MKRNLENLVNQISHQGYKINIDPFLENVWKISTPGDKLKLYSLDNFNKKVSLYENETLIFQISENEDLFPILRFLPAIKRTGNKVNIGIENLFRFCDVKSTDEKKRIVAILNLKNINMFRDRRSFAHYIANCLKEAGLCKRDDSDELDLSLIDIIINII